MRGIRALYKHSNLPYIVTLIPLILDHIESTRLTTTYEIHAYIRRHIQCVDIHIHIYIYLYLYTYTYIPIPILLPTPIHIPIPTPMPIPTPIPIPIVLPKPSALVLPYTYLKSMYCILSMHISLVISSYIG